MNISHMNSLKGRRIFTLANFLTICFLTANCQSLSQNIKFKDIELKLPSDWNYKSQVLEDDYLYQISCWEKGGINSFLIQFIDDKIIPDEYIEIMKESFKISNTHKNTSYSDIIPTLFNDRSVKECSFNGIFQDIHYDGKIIAFNSQSKSYIAVYQGNEAFVNGELLKSIINSLKINDNFLIKFNQEELLPEGWTEIEITNVGKIGIPPSMEIRDENSYISLVADIVRDGIVVKKKIEMEKASLTFQPKGMNELEKGAVSTYSRILIYHIKGEPGDFYKYNESFSLSISEMQELNKLFKEENESQMKKLNCKLLTWYPIEIITVNGMTSLKISYLRQLGNDIPVFVQSYNFFNDDEKIEIILSYRESEKGKWESDFKKVIGTFYLLTPQ